MIGRVATEPDKGLLHARNYPERVLRGADDGRPRETRRNFDVTRAEDFGDRKNLAAVFVGFLTAVAVEIPIDKKFKLDVL